MITVTTFASCVSLLPLSPLPAATKIPVVFFGICNRHFIIFCPLVPSRLWEKLSFALQGYKTHNEQTGRYHQQPPISRHWNLYIYMNYKIVLTDKKRFLFQFLGAPYNESQIFFLLDKCEIATMLYITFTTKPINSI